jgi:cobalt-zinc-cadmium resistance protein CzcA
MIHKLISWATTSRTVVILLALALVAGGLYSFFHVNVEAYPDPAPAIVEIVAQYPSASSEEVERLVTIPLETALASMKGLTYTTSRSLFQLSFLHCQFDYGIDFKQAKQDVLNRLAEVISQLPSGVTPVISPESPTGEIFRYTLSNPKDSSGRGVYTLNDLKALEDWTLERVFRRVPRIEDVSSFGGTVKRYEVHPDPDLLKRYGITLTQLQAAISGSNVNVGGDYLLQGAAAQVVRGIGLLGGGNDPVQNVLGMTDPAKAARFLRDEEDRRLREIREIGITSVNNVAVRVGDVVEGGRVPPGYDVGRQGVVVGHQTRLGQVSCDRPLKDERGAEIHRITPDGKSERVWRREDDVVQGIVLLRKDEQSIPAVREVEAKVAELNGPRGDKLLPGVKIEPYYDRSDLTRVTRETVNENLLTGMSLVGVILLMFLSNVRATLIVAINVPLALLFAFVVLYLRGKSANLLSIGAVDFGIIVDSSVIMVESIYRVLSSGEQGNLPLRQRVVRAAADVERSLFFSTLILVCALLPLFTMSGPEGQLFGPMAATYAFALAGALLLAVTLAPVLCQLSLKNVGERRDNLLVRNLKRVWVSFAGLCLRWRKTFLGIVGLMLVGTLVAVQFLGQEFMPELEEGNLWIRAEFPLSVSLEETVQKVKIARSIMEKYDEVELIVTQHGRPDDGTDANGFYNAEFFVPLKFAKDWPAVKRQTGLASWLHPRRARTKQELINEMSGELSRALVGVDWNFSQNIRDNVMEALSGVKGDNSVKIFGPDLAELERLAEETKKVLRTVDGIEDVGVFHIQGQTNLEFPIDRQKCARWNVAVADAWNALQSAVGGKPFSQMIEGEKTFDISLRWPQRLRRTKEQILDIPVDVAGNNVVGGSVGSLPQTSLTGSASGLTPLGTSGAMPSLTGGMFNAALNNLSGTPRRRLGDLVTAQGDDDHAGRERSFVHSGASTIYREQGNRMIAVKFGVRGRDLGGAVKEAREKTAPLYKPPYRAEWGGEFQEMQNAQIRLIVAVTISLVLILLLLYTAFRSMLDALVVLGSVLVVSLMGSVWALLLTGTNLSISAGVGFISIVGVGMMNGLLLLSMFNQFRADGFNVPDAILKGVERRARPLTMTALTAICGLLPAALATRIGSQTQKPLAIAVIGGMTLTLLLTNIIPVLYSFYGHRDPPAGSNQMSHGKES